MANQDDDNDEDDVDPMTILLPDEQEHENTSPSLEEDAAAKNQLQLQHYIRSIDSTVVIRQLPSQGLSFQLWPAATTLVTLLDQYRTQPSNSPLTATLSDLSNGQDHHRRLRILELGSGTGLVGIAAAATLGANVTVTDLPHVLSNLQFNADTNANSNSNILGGGSVHVTSLSWGEVDDMEAIGREFDLILGSDVVYHDHLYDPLLRTLRFFLGGGSTGTGDKKVVFVMAHLRRWKKESAFFKKAKKLFQVEKIHTDAPSHGSRVGVVVYRFCFAGKPHNLNAATPKQCLAP